MNKRFISREQIMNEFGYDVEEYNEIWGEDIVGSFLYEEEQISLDLRNDGKFVYHEVLFRKVFDSVREFEEWCFQDVRVH